MSSDFILEEAFLPRNVHLDKFLWVPLCGLNEYGYQALQLKGL